MKGEGVLTIRLKQQDDNHVLIELEDTGAGIPIEHHQDIFQPFFTTKGKGEGTGLGLSICKGILDKHQAKINLFSTPGQTLFQIILPIMPVENKIPTNRQSVYTPHD